MSNGNNNKNNDGFDTDVLDIARVSRVTSGGTRFSFRAVVAAGNGEGKVGVGVGKGNDVGTAISKASRLAKKHAIDVPITEEGSIPFEVKTEFKGSEVYMKPAAEGRGIKAGSVVRSICTLAGITDISAKIISKTRNKIANSRATLKAFKKINKILKVNQKEHAAAPTKSE